MLVRAFAVEMISAVGRELGVAAAVIRMMMRAEHVLHRLIGHALHLRHDAFVVLLELVVHQDDAFAGDIDRDVAAVAFDLVQIVLDLVERQRRGLLALILRVSDPAAR